MARVWKVQIDSRRPECWGWFDATFPRRDEAVAFAARFAGLGCKVDLISPTFVRKSLAVDAGPARSEPFRLEG